MSSITQFASKAAQIASKAARSTEQPMARQIAKLFGDNAATAKSTSSATSAAGPRPPKGYEKGMSDAEIRTFQRLFGAG